MSNKYPAEAKQAVASAPVALYVVDAEGNRQEKSREALIAIADGNQKYHYLLRVYIPGRLIMSAEISSILNFKYDKKPLEISWVLPQQGIVIVVQFETKEDFGKVSKAIQKAAWEFLNEEDFDKVVAKDGTTLEYMQKADAMDDEEEEEEDDEVKDLADAFTDMEFTNCDQEPKRLSSTLVLSEEDESSEEESEEEDDDERKSSIRRGTGSARKLKSSRSERNKQLAVGVTNNRMFVNRGASLGVYKVNEESGLMEYLNRVPTIQTHDKQVITPKQLLLQQQDTTMMLLDETNQTNLFIMDLERGQVVEEFTPKEGKSIRAISHSTKWQQQTTDQTLLGVNNNSVFLIDPRINSKDKIAKEKSYATQTKFSCVCSTENGYLVTASDKGEIRLYDSVEKNAKTLLPGLGDPIIGLDITSSGDYILATTLHYLLVIPTQANGKDGFKGRGLGQDKPTPIKLQLNPHDVLKHKLNEVMFTRACFNLDPKNEEWIVTSTGNLIVTWNFQKVKVGLRYDYRIKPCVNQVVADSFLYQKQDEVVVTLPNDIFLEKCKIKKPQPSSAKK